MDMTGPLRLDVAMTDDIDARASTPDDHAPPPAVDVAGHAILMTEMDDLPRPHVGFVLERALGHVTHAENLKQLLTRQSVVEADVFEVDYDTSGPMARVPLFRSNWTVRAGLRARRGIRRMDQTQRLDALFMHTQVPTVLSADWLLRIPTVISVDATPRQYDLLGEQYDHRREGRFVEAAKWHANRLSFRHAAHIVAWSEWTKRGLIDEYEVDASKVTVIPPGVMRSLWVPPEPRSDRAGPVRILFVGGAWQRKGGDLLLKAFDELRSQNGAEHPASAVELHVVTNTPLRDAPGVVVHRGLAPNDAALVDLYRTSDIFCLPTRADTHAIVLSEAASAGLALVSTGIAGLPEVVRDGETGLVVPPDDQPALVAALRRLVDAPELRRRLGFAASALAARDLDAEKNMRRLVELVAASSSERSRASRRRTPESRRRP
jgi:glycosyltransferase involved in cell wall biosynthesis